MSISVTVNGNPVNVNRGKITNSEIGGVKTKELQRRRKLRLLQVREQSNVIAKKIRERVSNEHLNILSDLDKTKKKAFASEQDQIVRGLEQRCRSNAENFGVGHASAAEQIAILEADHPAPDKSTERGNSAKALVHGTRKQGLEHQKRQLERKLLARNIANERSRQNFTSNFREKTQQHISETDIEDEEDEITNTNLDVTINSGADGSISIRRRISQKGNKQSSQTRTPSATIIDDTGPSTSKRYTETLNNDIETSKRLSQTSKRDIEIQCDVEFTHPDEPLQTSSKISLTNSQSNQVDSSERKELKTTQKSSLSKSTKTSSKISESREVGPSKNDAGSTQKDLLPIIEETKSAEDLSSKSLKSKSSLSIVSRFILDRDKRLPENRPGFHKVSDSDMEKIKETLIRTRTSEISSNINFGSDKSCKVYDTNSIPGPTWEPLRNTNFMAYNNHMNKVLLRPTTSERVSSKDSVVEKKQVQRPQSAKSKLCLVSKPVSPTKCGRKTKKSLTPSKKTPTASVKSSRLISASTKTTTSGRRSETAFVTQYDHVTRSIRDIPIDRNSPLVTKVSKKDRSLEDAFEAALKETSEVANFERSDLESGSKIGKTNLETGRSNLGSKRLEDMERRGEEAVQVEKVGKEYQELMKRLKQISREHAGAGKIIESAFMDDTRQNVRKSEHQRRMEEEFEKIQHDSAALSTYPDEAQQHKKSIKIQKQPIVNSVDDDTENLRKNRKKIEISEEATLSHNKTVTPKCSKCKIFKKPSEKIVDSDLNERCTQCDCIITNKQQDKLQQKDIITYLAPKSSEQACEKCFDANKSHDKCTNNVTSGDKCVDCGNYFKRSLEINRESPHKSCNMNKHHVDTYGKPCFDYSHKESNEKVHRKCCHTDKIVEREMEMNTEGGISSIARGNNGTRTSPRFSKKDVEDIMKESLKFLRAEGVMELNLGDKEEDVKKWENVAEVGRGDNVKVPLQKEITRNKMKHPKNISLSQAAADSQSEASVHSETATEMKLHRLVQEVERNQRIHKKRLLDSRKLMSWDTGAVRRPQKKSLKKKSRPAPIPSKTTECTEDFKTAIGPSLTIFPSSKSTEIPIKNNESPSKIILKTTKSASDHEFEIHIEFKKRVESIFANVQGDQKLVYAEDEVSKCSISSASTAYMKLPDKILPNGYRSNFFECYNAHVTEVDAEKTLSDVSDLGYSNESEWESTNVESQEKNCFGYCECGTRCEFCVKSCRKLKKDRLKKGLHLEICECEKDFLAFAQYQRYVGSNKLDLETFQTFLSELKRRESNRKKKQKPVSKRKLRKTEQVKKDGEDRRLSFLNDIFRDEIDMNGEHYARSSGTSTSTQGSQVNGSGSEIAAPTTLKVNSGIGTVKTVDIGVQGSPISDVKKLEKNHSEITKNYDKFEPLDSDKIPTKDNDNLIARKKKLCSKAHLKSQTKNASKKMDTKKYKQENELERIVQGNRFPYDFNSNTINCHSKKLDPQVQAYIKKLLTISRDKIALMEVSSSSVATPSSSIIETPANSRANMFQEDPEKLARLNKFFKENQDLVTGLLSISEDSVLLSKYDVETQIMHSNVPILKFKSKFKPTSDVNVETSSQSITRKDRKKLKPSVLARSRSRNLTKHFENRQVVEQKKLIRVLNSLGSVRQDFNTTNKKSKLTKPVNNCTARSSSVSEKQSPRIFTRPKTVPNVPIATVTATSKKMIDEQKATKEIVGIFSPKKLKTKIQNCNVEPIAESKSKKISPRLGIRKTQAVYERGVQEGRSFFPKDSKDSLRVNDNRVSTKMKSNSCNNVKRSEKSPRKTSPRHIQDYSPPVKETNLVKPMMENGFGDNTKINKKKPIKVCSKDVNTVLKSTVSAQTKKSSPVRQDVINAAYYDQKNRNSLLFSTEEPSHPEPKTSKQQKKGKRVECKPMNMENYADLTEKCTQRLSDINRVIEEVRKNKSNIYSHLSSGDSSRSESAKSGRSSSFSIDLLKDDIQVPKPTARDINEITEKSHFNANEEMIKHKNLVFTTKLSDPQHSSPKQEDFVPILGDIPKPNRLDNTSHCLPTNIIGPKALGSSIVSKSTGKSRPPLAFSRVMSKINPLEHIEAHELSTVVEVDSPLSVRNSSVNRTRNAFNKSPTIFETPKSVTGTKTKDHPAGLFKITPNSIEGKEENDSSKMASEVKISPLEGNSAIPSKRTDISLEKNCKDISNNKKKNGDFLKPDSKSSAEGRKSPIVEKIVDNTRNTTANSPKMEKNAQTDKMKIDSESIALSSYKNDDQDKENKFPMMEVGTFKDLMLKPFLTFEEYAKKMNLTVTEASLSDTTPSNNSKEKDSNNSEGTLPDIVAELLKRNVISEPFRIDGIPYASNIDSFDGKPNANSTTISPASSVSELAEKSTYRGKPEKILTKSKPRAAETRKMETNAPQQAEKSSTADLEGALQDLGMGWMLYTLRKTQESLALSSSSSSSKYGSTQPKMTSAQKLREAKKLLTQLPPSSLGSSTDIQSILANILPDTSSMESFEKNVCTDRDKNKDIPQKTMDQKNNVTQTEQQTSAYLDFGNDSNAIKNFIEKELANKITFSKESVSQNSDNIHYTSLYSTRNETTHIGDAENCDNSDVNSKSSSKARSHTRRTSTPVQLYKAQAYNNSSSSSLVNNSTALFSNVDDMSSVRASRCSAKNDSSSDRDGLSVPSVSLRLKSSKDRRNSKDSSSDGSNVFQRK